MKSILTIALILSGTIQYPMQAIAQTQKPEQTQQNTSQSVFIPPQTSPQIDTSTEIASKRNCHAATTEQPAVVTSQSEPVGGLTATEPPTFSFYLPFTNSLPHANAQFTLKDSPDNEIHRNTISIISNPGLVSASLPAIVIQQKNITYRCSLKFR